MKCPYCGGNEYETWVEWHEIDGVEGLYDCECCQDCQCLEGNKEELRNEIRNT